MDDRTYDEGYDDGYESGHEAGEAFAANEARGQAADAERAKVRVLLEEIVALIEDYQGS